MPRWRIGLTAILLVIMATLGSGKGREALAQSISSGGIINEIRVEGTQRIEPESVRSYMRVNPGDPFDLQRLDQSLKGIFATGLFSDVTLRREGDALIVVVVENPIINRIAFEGNQRIEDDTLEAEAQLRPRVVYTRTKVQNDVQRILEVYRRSGRYAATVDPKIIELDQNRVDLVFEIYEGPLTTINSINFIGNTEFSDGTLRDEISTAEYTFWNILSTTDTYDPDRLAFDRELLRRFYLSEGYADFRVLSAVAELTPDREGFIVTFTVDEGPRYEFGDVAIVTSLQNLDPEELRDDLDIEAGDWYDAEAIQDAVDVLNEAVGNLGFAFVDIRTQADRDRENLKIDITFDIQEGPKVFVERIQIEGNVRTLDKVIRREFRLVEGDAFNSARLRRSRTRIQNLGFFSSVDVETLPGSQPDRTVIQATVEEQSTGDLSFGAGFSTDSGIIGNVGIRERNLLGRGQDLRFSASLAGSGSEIDISFTEPYFLGRNLAAGIDLFRIVSDQSQFSFESERLGGSLRAGFDLSENLRQVVRYTAEQRKIKNVNEDASSLVQDEEGTTFRSGVSTELTYDTRDSRFDTRDGYVVGGSAEFTGLGGDVSFFKGSLNSGYWYTLADEWTISVRGEYGQIVGLGQDTRVSDRFFIGGTSPRGFEFAGIGPRDLRSDDPVGGKQFYTGSLQLSFPLGLPSEFDVRGRLFTDIGSAWGWDGNLAPPPPGEPADEILDSVKPRISVGTGFSWDSPFGPVIVDLGFAVVKEDFDKTEILSFSFGTQF
ncbi:MAG: outer membrane protein assembly factor BamA [Pseudomonadota bacterium]